MVGNEAGERGGPGHAGTSSHSRESDPHPKNAGSNWSVRRDWRTARTDMGKVRSLQIEDMDKNSSSDGGKMGRLDKRFRKQKWTGFSLLRYREGFPSGSDGKASAYNVGDLGSIPGLGRSPGEGNGNPLQYSWLENPMDREAW